MGLKYECGGTVVLLMCLCSGCGTVLQVDALHMFLGYPLPRGVAPGRGALALHRDVMLPAFTRRCGSATYTSALSSFSHVFELICIYTPTMAGPP